MKKLRVVQKWKKENRIIKSIGEIDLRDDVSRLEGEFIQMKSEVEFLKNGWRMLYEKEEELPLDKTSKIC